MFAETAGDHSTAFHLSFCQMKLEDKRSQIKEAKQEEERIQRETNKNKEEVERLRHNYQANTKVLINEKRRAVELARHGKGAAHYLLPLLYSARPQSIFLYFLFLLHSSKCGEGEDGAHSVEQADRTWLAGRRMWATRERSDRSV